jgi:glutamate mutase epsilon subunit
MSPAEWGLLVGILANAVGLVMTLVKVVSWMSSHVARVNERLGTLERQVDNDITGRKAVGEMRQDIAVIKSQVEDIRETIKSFKIHSKNGAYSLDVVRK